MSFRPAFLVAPAVLAGALSLALARPVSAATFTVNGTGDHSDTNTADGVCVTTPGPCTLRAAIQQANATAGTDTIAFLLGGGAPYTIAPASGLPPLTGTVVLDATTQPGYGGNPLVVISGASAGGGVSGLVLGAGSDGSTVKGFAVQGFSGNGMVVDSGTNTIVRSHFGTNAAGSVAVPNALAGILVNGASNVLGGANYNERVTVSGNGGGGVVLAGNSNTLQYSFVGTVFAGSSALANSGAGVTISGSSNRLLQMVVSGNTGDGIRITGGTANIVETNTLLGTNNLGSGALPNGGNGIAISGSTNNRIGPGNIISGNSGYGVFISGAGATGNVVKSSFVGTAISGTTALPNGLAGIGISGASANTVGGPVGGDGNIVSGNAAEGIRIVGGSGNTVQANQVGLRAGGTAALGNGSHGILVDNSANVTIGLNFLGPGNSISGNGGSGIHVLGPGSTGAYIVGNALGNVATGGPTAIPNALDGITLVNATGAILGNLGFAEDNVVSGNTRHGIYVSGGGGHHIRQSEIGADGDGLVAIPNGGCGVLLENTSGNTVEQNQLAGNVEDGLRIVGGGTNTVVVCMIGLDLTGNVAMPNGMNGISIQSSSGNAVGEIASGRGNTVSGNSQNGIVISGGSGNVVKNSLVGTRLFDAGPLPNGLWGVVVSGSSGNSIGGAEIGAGNRIRWNGSGAVSIRGGTGNIVRRNSISGNLGLGIDLDADGALPLDGVTANDATDSDAGSNNLQNAPVLTSASTVQVVGTLRSAPGTSYTIEVFGSARCDTSGHGEGENYLNSVTATTDGAGLASWNVGIGVAAGTVISATATAPSGDTSEFSQSIPTIAPVDFDRNGRSEIGVFRAGAWQFYDWTSGAATTSAWTGSGGCTPFLMDYDGDGTDDYTLYCGSVWHFYNDDGSYNKGVFIGGGAGDVPVPADYDGDGKDDVVVFRSGAWNWYDFTSGAYVPSRSVWTGAPAPWGASAIVPVPMDYDGDGKADRSIHAGGPWHFFNPNGSYNKGIWTGSIAGDVPVPADYDGGGHDDVAIFRNGAWLFWDFWTGASQTSRSVWTGRPAHSTGGTSMPAPIDPDGDGLVNLAIYAGGPWYFYNPNGSVLKSIFTGAVAGTKDLSTRPVLP